MFGSHLSIAGGMENALIRAHELGMDCVQVFTKNQRQWTPPPLTDTQVQAWREHQALTGIKQTVSHDSYLINLASPAPETWGRSIALYREELVRCERLGIPLLVMHPGAHMKAGEEAGLARVAEALNRLHDELPGLSVLTLIETTAGQGTSLGAAMEHLAILLDRVEADQRLGVCLDTAHLLAAGYDLTSAAGARSVLAELDAAVGLDRVKAIHLNDSKTPHGSRVDRHEHIGHGHVALEAFGVIVNHPAFPNVPKILETAKEDAPDGRPWDVVNLETLRGLVRKAGRARAPSGRRKSKKG